MRFMWLWFLTAIYLSGCGGWGDYVHKSDRFKFKIAFPVHWEVYDRSDNQIDYLEATLPDVSREARIVVRATPVAPDISPTEIYPMFLEGSGDAAILLEFVIEEKGTISSKTGDGRFIKISYLTEEHRIRGIRTLFLGGPVRGRYRLEVSMEMPADNFLDHEADFRKMISLMELK